MKLYREVSLIWMGIFLWFVNIHAHGPDSLWTKIYGGVGFDEGWSVQQTSDSGYIITGYTSSFGAGYKDVYLIKTDVDGDTLWTRTYGGVDWDAGRSVQQTSDGGYIIAGHTESFGAGSWDVYLIKTNSLGDTLWVRTYGGTNVDAGLSVQQISDGDYIVVGYTASFGASCDDVYIVKTDSLGNALWTKMYGGSLYDFAWSVQETADNGFIIAGSTNSFGAGMADIYLLRTDSSGDTLWTKTFGGADADVGYAVQKTTDGGYIVIGYTFSFGLGEQDVYLIKTDSLGDTLWTRTYGGSDIDGGVSVQVTADGGFFIAGYTTSFGMGDLDVYLIKVDSDGDTIWTRTFGGISSDKGYSAQQTYDGGYIIVGNTYSFGAGLFDVYLIKTELDVGIKEERDRRHKTTDIRLATHPNPFTDKVRINLGMDDVGCKMDDISLNIYDVSGRLIKSFQLPTAYSLLPTVFKWDGRDNEGKRVSGGVYFLKLKAGEYNTTSKLLKMR